MKTIIALFALLAIAAAAPQGLVESREGDHHYVIIPILRFEEDTHDNGGYNFLFETENGIIRQQEGRPSDVPGSNGAIVKTGSWSYNLEDGTRAEFDFVADEGGFQVNSPLLPPIPAFVQEQIDKAERERAAGIIHDGHWDAELYNTGEHDGQWDPIRYA